MTYNFTVSPDFNPDHLSGWFIFNTWLQKAISEAIHLDLYDDFDSQRKAIAEDRFDLAYSNPYDATVLVREKGFVPVVCPKGVSDEAIIAVRRDSPVKHIEDLPTDARIATTADPDVRMMCMIMLEPADISGESAQIQYRDTYVLVAKDLIRGEADIGFFLEETFEDLSKVIRQELRPLVHSEIQLIHHVLLIGPRLAHKRAEVQQHLANMHTNEKGRKVLEGLGFEAWETVDQEETEFMIDLMDTLEAG